MSNLSVQTTKTRKPHTSLESNTVTISLNPADFVSKEMQEQRCRPNVRPWWDVLCLAQFGRMALNQKQLRVHVTEQFISDILVYIVVNIQLSFEWESVYCIFFFLEGTETNPVIWLVLKIGFFQRFVTTPSPKYGCAGSTASEYRVPNPNKLFRITADFVSVAILFHANPTYF